MIKLLLSHHGLLETRKRERKKESYHPNWDQSFLPYFFSQLFYVRLAILLHMTRVIKQIKRTNLMVAEEEEEKGRRISSIVNGALAILCYYVWLYLAIYAAAAAAAVAVDYRFPVAMFPFFDL